MRKRAIVFTVILTATCFQSCSGILSTFDQAFTQGTAAVFGQTLGAGFTGTGQPAFGVPLQQATGILTRPALTTGSGGGGP